MNTCEIERHLENWYLMQNERHHMVRNVVLRELPNTGHGCNKRTIDMAVFRCWQTDGRCIDFIEVKSSRSDFLRELKNPKKTEGMAKFCNRFFFACPEKLIKKNEVPDPFGLLWIDANGWVAVKKKAIKTEAPTFTTSFVIELARAVFYHNEKILCMTKGETP